MDSGLIVNGGRDSRWHRSGHCCGINDGSWLEDRCGDKDRLRDIVSDNLGDTGGLRLCFGLGFGNSNRMLPASRLTAAAACSFRGVIVSFNTPRATSKDIFHIFAAFVDTTLLRTGIIFA